MLASQQRETYGFTLGEDWGRVLENYGDKLMTEAKYEEHLVVFIDLLGVREASYDDKTTQENMLKLFTELATWSGEFSIRVKPQENGNSIQVRPAVSTFSDHIILTYPISSLKEHNIDWAVLIFLQKIISKIAIQSLQREFLLRGGITIGSLYHSQGVVFGETLIEAVNLESNIANYPRIVVSPKALQYFQIIQNSGLNAFIEDFDGISYFDYLRNGITECSTIGDGFVTGFKHWVNEASLIIWNNVADFKQKGELKKLAKWIWFKKYFDRCLSVQPASLFLSQ